MKLTTNKKQIISLQDTDKKINFHLSNRKYEISDRTAIIFHKDKIKQKRLKNIDKGIGIFRLADRHSIANLRLDHQACKIWLNIYQQFNENTGNLESYLYGFDKKNINHLNKALDQLGLDLKAKAPNRFVLLEKSVDISIKQYKQIFEKWQKKEKYKSIFSFLLGITLAYGHIDQDNESLKSIKAHIPFKGINKQIQPDLTTLLDFLDNNTIWNKIDIQKDKRWFTYQLIIKDFEFLWFLKTYHPYISTPDILTLQKAKSLQKRLIDYIQKVEFENSQKFIDQIKKRPLKTQTT